MGGKSLHKYGKKLFISHGVRCMPWLFWYPAPFSKLNHKRRNEQ